MDRNEDKKTNTLDELLIEISKFDEETLSFHNLIVLENIKEVLTKISKMGSFNPKSETELLPPVPVDNIEHFQYRVAIIDDDQDTQNLLKFYFEKNDIAVGTYLSSLEALDQITTDSFDLLLVDLMMPEMTGFEFIQKIKPKIDLNKTKIIVGSAKNNQLDRMNALNMGAIDFINKPYDLSELFLVIKRNLEKDAA